MTILALPYTGRGTPETPKNPTARRYGSVQQALCLSSARNNANNVGQRKMDRDLTDSLLGTCRLHVLETQQEETVPEPYIPYVPENWNRGLVLAEAQNHGAKSHDYLTWLREQDSTTRMLRLYARGDGLGCQPWDDGSLKLAVANAVLWSRIDRAKRNDNPSKRMERNSVKVWCEFLEILSPEWVVTAGKVARMIIDQTQYQGCRLSLKLPSPSYLSRVSGLFDEEDLLQRYPEVLEVMEGRPELLRGGYRRNKIFFACHAVSSAQKSGRVGASCSGGG